jgi:hypothetical protein
MAEVLALVGTIIAVIQIADRVINVCEQYLEQIQDAPRDLHIILIETSTLKALAEGLKFLHGANKCTTATLQALGDQNGPIEGCRRCISDLERLLGLDTDPAADGKRRMIQATLGRLAWPLKESKARKLLRELSHYKTTITLALSNESMYERFHYVLAVSASANLAP